LITVANNLTHQLQHQSQGHQQLTEQEYFRTCQTCSSSVAGQWHLDFAERQFAMGKDQEMVDILGLCKEQSLSSMIALVVSRSTRPNRQGQILEVGEKKRNWMQGIREVHLDCYREAG
jgi:hypothetical protein